MSESDAVERARAAPIEDVVARFGVKLRRSGLERIGPCPRCGGDDRFSINLQKNIWNCRGCEKGGDVISLVEFLYNLDFAGAVERLTGTAPTAKRGNGAAGEPRMARAKLGPIVARFDYVDEAGALLFQVTKHEPKDFRQRKPDPDNAGGWIADTDGVRLVPYRLPELIEALSQDKVVFIVEGEKDADNVIALGAPATCNPRGAGKWANCKIDDHFNGARVVIIADNDPQTRNKRTGELLFHEDGRPRFAGWDHAQDVAKHLSEVASSVRVVDLQKVWPACPEKGDISNWIEQGGTIDQLYDIADSIPEWSPSGDIKRPVTVISKRDFITGFQPPSYLVEGVLQRGFIYALTGATAHAKSAIALLLADLVTSVDRNAMLGKHKVEKGRALYFVGENPDDIRMRVIGADSVRLDDDGALAEFYFIDGQIDIKEQLANIGDEVREIGGVDFVVVDTSAAYFLGDEELSNTQMGAHARTLRKLTKLPGNPCVLVLCHPVKQPQDWTQLLPRGGGAFLAEMDGNLTAWKHDDILVELNYTKMRGPGFEPMTFKLETIHSTRLIDDKGRALPTVRAIVATESEQNRQTQRVADDQDRVLAQMAYQPNQSFAEIARALDWFNGVGEPLKGRVQRVITKLEKVTPKLVKKNIRDQWELTDKGKEAAAQAARSMPSQVRENVQEALL